MKKQSTPPTEAQVAEAASKGMVWRPYMSGGVVVEYKLVPIAGKPCGC